MKFLLVLSLLTISALSMARTPSSFMKLPTKVVCHADEWSKPLVVSVSRGQSYIYSFMGTENRYGYFHVDKINWTKSRNLQVIGEVALHNYEVAVRLIVDPRNRVVHVFQQDLDDGKMFVERLKCRGFFIK